MMCQSPSVFCSLAADGVPEIFVNGVILLIVDQGSVMFIRIVETNDPPYEYNKSAPIYSKKMAFVSNFVSIIANI